ncbi:hypothetical protein AVEN_228798-1, partial [Araneus ventricosus]
EECRQLVAVSSLLVTALENAVKGNFVDMDCVLSACTTHLPDLEKLRSESPHFGNSAQVSHPCTAKKPHSSEKLDFNKLKLDIKSSDEKTRALLFQALRWFSQRCKCGLRASVCRILQPPTLHFLGTFESLLPMHILHPKEKVPDRD